MTERCGILAGQGVHPLRLAEALANAGPAPFVICIENQSDADFSGFEHQEIAIGQIATITKTLKRAGCTAIMMAGKVVRPPLLQMKLDKTGMFLLSKARLQGDDNLLRIIEGHFESAGLAMRNPDDVLPRLSLPAGYHFGPELSAEQRQTLALGVELLTAIGQLDVGQGCIVQNARILAIEGTEGTDGLIRRSSELIDSAAGPAMLLKMMKSGQDKKHDAPGFGLQTLTEMAKSGVTVLALEAETCRSSDSLSDLEAFATTHKLTLLALPQQTKARD